MSKEYISIERLEEFIENIKDAPEATVDEVDYLLCTKDGRLYKVYTEEPSDVYLRVYPKELQWVYSTDDIYYDVKSNTRWNVG